MKKLLLIPVLLLAQNSMAAGYHCTAHCIQVTSTHGGLQYLGSVEASGSKNYFTSKTLFAHLNQLCSKRVYYEESNATVSLVDGLRATAYRYDERFGRYLRIESQSVHYGSVSSTPGVRLHHSDFWNDAPAWSYASPIGTHSRLYDVEYWPSSETSSCTVDLQIRDDEVPEYDGDISILTD